MTNIKTLRDHNNEDDYHAERAADAINGKGPSMDYQPVDEGEPDDDNLTNAAIITLDHKAQQLVIFFGDDRNAVMELDNDFEFSLCETAMADPNFWINFLGSFSAAIKKSS